VALETIVRQSGLHRAGLFCGRGAKKEAVLKWSRIAVSPAQEIETCSLYTVEKRTLREVGDAYGLSPAGILKILIRNKVERRSKGTRRTTNGDERGGKPLKPRKARESRK
jgi:hypothetical protein